MYDFPGSVHGRTRRLVQRSAFLAGGEIAGSNAEDPKQVSFRVRARMMGIRTSAVHVGRPGLLSQGPGAQDYLLRFRSVDCAGAVMLERACVLCICAWTTARRVC